MATSPDRRNLGGTAGGFLQQAQTAEQKGLQKRAGKTPDGTGEDAVMGKSHRLSHDHPVASLRNVSVVRIGGGGGSPPRVAAGPPPRVNN